MRAKNAHQAHSKGHIGKIACERNDRRHRLRKTRGAERNATGVPAGCLHTSQALLHPAAAGAWPDLSLTLSPARPSASSCAHTR